MNKVAVVVQRCHESIVGGSESLAWQYANLLKERFQSEVITTTAISTSDWANSLPAGEELQDGVLLRRFPVTIGRTPYWGNLHGRLMQDYKVNSQASSSGETSARWSLPLQDEFIRTQGPYSAPMLEFIRQRWRDYQTIIFVTYLYPTSYFGLSQVPKNFALFAPTLHNEEPAYLSVYGHAARRAREIIWLTEAEQRLGRHLWGELPGRVIGMNIDTVPRQRNKPATPFILYCGRIDPNKGCVEMFDHFIRFKKENPGNLKLVLAGIDDIPIPSHRDIDFRGFVSTETKFELMAGSTAFVMPSGQESFSIVTLEAMAQSVPVLASGKSAVITDHIKKSGGGFVYESYEDFANHLKKLMADKDNRRLMGERGRNYVTANYKLDRVRESLIAMVESCGESTTSTAHAR